jgi:MFS superfamily sulfate permease-like transporter
MNLDPRPALTIEPSAAAPARSPGNFRRDLLASVVVFLVALPLCMGIALASGVSTGAGIVTGIIGGLVVGALAGSPLQVSGPAAGLTVLVWELVREHGPEVLGPVVLAAGALQLAAGLGRLGQWFRAVSPSVIQGMLSGIGVLIFASQFHFMVDDAPKGSGIRNLLSIPEAVWKGIVPNDATSHNEAALVGLLTICVLGGWKQFAPARLKLIPAPLVAVLSATLAAALLDFPVQRVNMPDNLFAELSGLGPSWLAVFREWRSLLPAVFAMAFIASAETLLCAAAVDQLNPGPRTRYDRELAAQGVGNMLCGLAGALPLTGVIVRSAANVEAGARTRLSAVLHGAWLLLFVCLAPGLLGFIPTSSLAAVLVFTGYHLMNPRAIRSLRPFGKGEVFIYAATLLTIVAVDLLTGVLVGLALSVVKLLLTFSHLSVRLHEEPGGLCVQLTLRGAATFIRLPRLAAALESVASGAELHVRFDELTFIDHACLDYLMNWQRRHEAAGGRLVIDWDNLMARFRPRRRDGARH